MCCLNTVREPRKKEKKTWDFAFARRMKKHREGENTAKETGGESDSFLESWSQDFGAMCLVYMTSCIVSPHLLFFPFARCREARPAPRNGKME